MITIDDVLSEETILDTLRAHTEKHNYYVEQCENYGGRELSPTCNGVLVWAAYEKHLTDGMVEWLTDHLSDAFSIESVNGDEYTPTSDNVCVDTDDGHEWLGVLAMRTEPDHYGWLAEVQYTDGQMWHVYDDKSDMIDAFIEDGQGTSVAMITEKELIGLGWHRFTPLEHFETGWHPGQNEDPANVIKAIHAKHGEDVQTLPLTLNVGQFDARWTVYYRQEPS